MKAYLFTALLGLSALSSCKATSNTSYTEGPVITLKMGEEKSLQKEKLKIKFVDVPEDSRCPMNARCIWIGNARIKLKVNNQTLILDTQDMPDRKYAKLRFWVDIGILWKAFSQIELPILNLKERLQH